MTKTGVIIANLGTPKNPDPRSVGQYLGEFLMDPLVIQMPWLLRFLLVRGIIVPLRKSQSAANYQKVWSKEGSPLLVETQKMVQALRKELGEAYQVEAVMRYGEPSLAQVEQKLSDCDKIIFFPQYPQFADSTVETSLRHLENYFLSKKVQVVEPYYEESNFIAAYSQFLTNHLKDLAWDHLLMSFHGLPESHIQRRDPTGKHCLMEKNCCQEARGQVLRNCYRAQCFASAQKLAIELGLNSSQYSVSFQSRLGRQKWIEPYTEQMYKNLVDSGVKKLAVICPGFAVDGLETLEEIAMQGRAQFEEMGGESFHYIPCLNDAKPWIDACVEIVKNYEKLL